MNNIASDYEVTEDVTAGYVQGTHQNGPPTVIAGVRYERTEIDSDSTRAFQGRFVPVSPNGSYDNVLPGLHARYN